MKKSKIEFQKGLNLPIFLTEYGTEEQCYQILANSSCVNYDIALLSFFDFPLVSSPEFTPLLIIKSSSIG